MITLKPPFCDKDLDGLLQKVVKGNFSKLPSHYSDGLTEMCNLLIRVQPNNRPSCGK